MSGRDDRFGRNGDAPTPFELELLQASELDGEIWVVVGQRIGAAALFQIFDELGGMIVSVPRRESFIRRVYLPRRDAEALAMSRDGRTHAEIGAQLGVDPSAVTRARCRALRTRRRSNGR